MADRTGGTVGVLVAGHGDVDRSSTVGDIWMVAAAPGLYGSAWDSGAAGVLLLHRAHLAGQQLVGCGAQCHSAAARDGGRHSRAIRVSARGAAMAFRCAGGGFGGRGIGVLRKERGAAAVAHARGLDFRPRCPTLAVSAGSVAARPLAMVGALGSGWHLRLVVHVESDPGAEQSGSVRNRADTSTGRHRGNCADPAWRSWRVDAGGVRHVGGRRTDLVHSAVGDGADRDDRGCQCDICPGDSGLGGGGVVRDWNHGVVRTRTYWSRRHATADDGYALHR